MNITKEEAEEIVDKYLDEKWAEIQSVDFPPLTEREITEKECINELRNNKILKNWKTPSKIVRKFNQSLFKANKGGSFSPYEYWNKLKEDKELYRRFLVNRLTYSDWFKEKNNLHREDIFICKVPLFIQCIGMTSSQFAPMVSYFKPQQMRYLIENYAKDYDTIFDPFMGYAGRLLGTVASNKNYIGRDINDITVSENLQVVEFIKQYDKGFTGQIDIGVGDSLNSKGEFPCLITCPPYSGKGGKQIEEWMSSSGKISCKLNNDEVIDNILNNYKCEKYIIVIDDTVKYKDYVVDAFVNKSYIGARNGGKPTENSEQIVVIEK